MAYPDFKTFNQLKDKFSVTVESKHLFFSNVPEADVSQHLQETLNDNVTLALNINTEKARSELIVMQVLVEVRKNQNRLISVFSGVEFIVDSDAGLSGYCDFIISHSPNQIFVTAPVICMVEAKNENLKTAYPQCIAEMIAAQRFNSAQSNPIDTIWGVATNGYHWKFLSLVGDTVEIDYDEYSIEQIGKLLGIFQYILGDNSQ
ncbi:MAG: hypothetical protein AAF639_16315 [Chloroflexota bacterium]